MTHTLAEKLQEKMGHKIECGFCSKKKILTPQWRMNTGHKIICPTCLIEKKDIIGTVISI